MEKFRFKYSVSAVLITVLVIILSLVGIIWNIFNIFNVPALTDLKRISYILVIIVAFLLLFFSTSLLCYAYYILQKDAKKLIIRFGLIKTSVDLNDVTEIALFTKCDKLVLYFKDAKYTVIVIDPASYKKFADSLLKLNPQIVYSQKIEEE